LRTVSETTSLIGNARSRSKSVNSAMMRVAWTPGKCAVTLVQKRSRMRVTAAWSSDGTC